MRHAGAASGELKVAVEKAALGRLGAEQAAAWEKVWGWWFGVALER